MAKFVLLLSSIVPKPLHPSKVSFPCFVVVVDHKNQIKYVLRE